MFSSKIYSHPDKYLYIHLLNVANACLEKFQKIQHSLEKFFPLDKWEKLVWIMGFSHDFGKATSYFQEYLFAKEETRKRLKLLPETRHSLISSIFTYWISKHLIAEAKIEEKLFKIMPFFLFLIVKKHHGNLTNAVPLPDSEERNELYDLHIEHLDSQLKSIERQELQLLFHLIHEKIGLKIQVNSIPTSFVDYYKKEIRKKQKREFIKLTKHLEHYLIFQYLYSLLLHSDKEDVIFGNSLKINSLLIEPEIVDRFKQKKFGRPKTKMNKIRDSIYKKALTTLSQYQHKLTEHKIFSLNVPTGTGKTLTALAIALYLRKILKTHHIHAKIIYGLPFTSIIDQNYDVFSQVFEQPCSDLLLKHHYLADVSYKIQDREAEFETNKAKFMIESWESEIIVTTFFQIFHTLFTNKNRMIQKFHALANSIVLLDEVQTLPYPYWKLLKETLSKLSELFNVYFILLTATQPKIFEPEEIIELVPNKKEYFDQVDRVELQLESPAIPLSSFIEICKKELEATKESFLFVMNTIHSSIQLYKSLKEIGLDADYYYLSTNIIPKHRLERIEAIKRNPHRKIIVSTQVVEAGVDIDIENVWRDFGPLESINQICGRCNRNFEGKKGQVRIFEILDEKNSNRSFASYLYQKNLLSLSETKNILSKNKISEREFLKNMDKYYAQLKEKLREDKSDELIEYLQYLRFIDIYKNFQLIDEKGYPKGEVFVEFDEKALEIWERYQALQNIKEIYERKSEFLKFKREFYEYIVSVPIQYIELLSYQEKDELETPPWLYYLPLDMIDEYYDHEIGWIRENDNFESYIL